jgi:hypothetical protein
VGEIRRGLAGALGEPESVEQVQRPGLRGSRLHPVDGGEERQVLLGTELVVERWLFRREPHAALGVERPRPHRDPLDLGEA